MNIKINLNTKGVEDAIKSITTYKKDLHGKCVQLVKEMADLGIQTANFYTTSSLVFFGKDIEDTSTGCKAIMYGKDLAPIIQTWVGVGGEVRTEEVSPLLMAEFGSGFKAKNPNNVGGVGQGTFPNQTHAFDRNGWWWMDLDGEWHHSYGIEPTQPMYKASIAMLTQIDGVIRKVFRS